MSLYTFPQYVSLIHPTLPLSHQRFRSFPPYLIFSTMRVDYGLDDSLIGEGEVIGEGLSSFSCFLLA